MNQATGMFGDYFAMGGYAAFIWPSYGLALVLLTGLLVLSLRRLRIAEHALVPDRTQNQARPDGTEANP